MKGIKQLEGALDSKTLRFETLNVALAFNKAKKCIASSPLLPGGLGVRAVCQAFGVLRNHVRRKKNR